MMTGASPHGPRFTHFDSLRGLAVLAVVVFHVSALTDHIGRGITGQLSAPLGTIGVSIFFVLSGFLLYRPHVAARHGGPAVRLVGAYLLRRARRILPPYWVALTLLAIFPGITGVFSGDFWRYYGLLQIYWEDTVGGGISVAWTLCVEATFYLVLPIWAMLAARARSERSDLLALLGVVVLSGALQIATMQHSVNHLVAVALPGQAIWFATGMLLAHASVRGTAPLVRAGTSHGLALWLVAAGCVVGLALLTSGEGFGAWLLAIRTPTSMPEAVARVTLMLVLCVAFTVPAIFGEDVRDLPRRLLGWRPVRFVGTISYGLFLYHLTVAQWLWNTEDPSHFSARGLGLVDHVGNGGAAVMLVLTLAVSLPLGWLSYRFVERRFIDQ